VRVAHALLEFDAPALDLEGDAVLLFMQRRPQFFFERADLVEQVPYRVVHEAPVPACPAG
jgi:hypothetical protein